MLSTLNTNLYDPHLQFDQSSAWRYRASWVVVFYLLVVTVSKGLASLRANSPGCSGGGAGKKESLQLRLSLEFEFRLLFPCVFQSTELSDFRQSARSGHERECKQTLKNTWKHAPRVKTSLLMPSPPISISHRPFRCRYLNSRDQVANLLSFFFPPRRQSTPESLHAG